MERRVESRRQSDQEPQGPFGYASRPYTTPQWMIHDRNEDVIAYADTEDNAKFLCGILNMHTIQEIKLNKRFKCPDPS